MVTFSSCSSMTLSPALSRGEGLDYPFIIPYWREGRIVNDMTQGKRNVVRGKVKMTPSEALVETLVAQGVTDIFGIVGSAYMDALDIFPAAGIRFIPVAHEQGAVHMA